MDQRSVSDAVASLRKRIANAGGIDVALVGVTKTFGSEAWRFAKVAGCDAVGENYAQEVVAKAADVALADRLPVHFIGQLQSNKIKQLVGIVDVWQSVDRLSLLTEIAKRSPHSAQVFLQVNVTGEEGKGGCPPAEVGELSRAAQDLGITTSINNATTTTDRGMLPNPREPIPPNSLVNRRTTKLGATFFFAS